jgi:hypothetical protein
MTRKDYELIASVIARRVDSAGDEFTELNAITKVGVSLSAEFQRQNPRFDRERFLKACGLIPA